MYIYIYAIYSVITWGYADKPWDLGSIFILNHPLFVSLEQSLKLVLLVQAVMKCTRPGSVKIAIENGEIVSFPVIFHRFLLCLPEGNIRAAPHCPNSKKAKRIHRRVGLRWSWCHGAETSGKVEPGESPCFELMVNYGESMVNLWLIMVNNGESMDNI